MQFSGVRIDKKFSMYSLVSVLSLLIGSVLFTILAPSASAATPPDSCFAFNAATGAITSYYEHQNNNAASPACTKEVDIPSTIGGVSVTAIGTQDGLPWDAPFASRSLTSVTIPSSVTLIGGFAFIANNLTSVTIPASVSTIHRDAFGENQLSAIQFSEGLLKIEDSAFSNNQLTNLALPEGLQSINSMAFRDNSITSVTIPNTVGSMGYAVFANNKISSVAIPDSITVIPESAFDNNLLTEISIPDSVTLIDRAAFAYNKLTSVTIPSSVTRIKTNAFGWNLLENVKIEDAAVVIEQGAFTGRVFSGDGGYPGYDGRRNRISILQLGNSVISIGSQAFAGNNLQEVTIHGNPTLAHDSFDMNGLDNATVPKDLTYDYYKEYEYYQNNANLVRIYADDPAFIAANKDSASITNVIIYDEDYVELDQRQYVTGGVLINPASLVVRYVNASNTELQTQLNIIGPDQSTQDYTIASALSNITIGETEVIEDWGSYFLPTGSFNDASVYYRIGQVVTPELPSIEGYITPQSRTFSLAGSTNEQTFTYLTQAQIDAGATINPDGSATIPSTPNTGLAAVVHSNPALLIFAVVAAIGGGILVSRKRHNA